MAFMLIAVTLFFALVGMFLLVIVFAGLKESGKTLEEQNALSLASRLANSPEFSCGDAFGTRSANCIDFDKAMALKQNIQRYDGFWGVKGIEILKIYPDTGSILCTEENYPECGKIEILKTASGVGVSNFVALCGKISINGTTQDNCDLARLIITYEGNK